MSFPGIIEQAEDTPRLLLLTDGMNISKSTNWYRCSNTKLKRDVAMVARHKKETKCKTDRSVCNNKSDRKQESCFEIF